MPTEHSAARMDRSPSSKQGWVYGISAYVYWGVMTAYWPLLSAAGPLEIFAHRVVWSCVTLVILVFAARRTRQLLAIVRKPRARVLLIVASLANAITWVLNIVAANFGYVIELSIGSFISPLLIVLLGVLVFRERITPTQWAALGIALIAIVVLTIDLGRLPWIALSVAILFSIYGMLKKIAGVEAIESLAYETLCIVPIMLVFLLVQGAAGDQTFTTNGWAHALLMVGSGLVTVIPLLLFSAATVRIPMVSIGLLQYIIPVLQFLLGLYWFREEVGTLRWVGVWLVWLAVILFSASAVHQYRRQQGAADSN